MARDGPDLWERVVVMFKRYAPHAVVILLTTAVVVAAFSQKYDQPPGYSSSYYNVDPKTIDFRDDVTPQKAPEESLTELVFLDINGREVQLKDYVGKKNVVLVMTRGVSSSICVYCSAQTSRLIANYPEFTKRNTEVVVIFPLRTVAEKNRLNDFISATKKSMDRPPERIPFPILLDVELKAVDKLGIRHDLSKPATFILDQEGQVRFSYVGQTLTDRPSVKALLRQIDAIGNGAS